MRYTMTVAIITGSGIGCAILDCNHMLECSQAWMIGCITGFVAGLIQNNG